MLRDDQTAYSGMRSCKKKKKGITYRSSATSTRNSEIERKSICSSSTFGIASKEPQPNETCSNILKKLDVVYNNRNNIFKRNASICI